ncbi:HU family DNA-binding protein [Azospirillum brasilense]|nr:HU family DNA-binding protein [Azospirillum brasilense]
MRPPLQPNEARAMNKAEFIELIAGKLGSSKADAGRALDAVTEGIAEVLAKGGDVKLTGFGIFEVREVAARQGRNLHTGATIEIPAGKAPKFKPSSTLKQAVGGQTADAE